MNLMTFSALGSIAAEKMSLTCITIVDAKQPRMKKPNYQVKNFFIGSFPNINFISLGCNVGGSECAEIDPKTPVCDSNGLSCSGM